MAERLLVRDLMSVGVTTCPLNAPIGDIARLMLEKDLEGIVVLDAEGHGAGVITQDELARAYGLPNRAALTAEAIMRDGVPQVPPDIPLIAAAQLMRDQRVRVFFLMHHAGGIIYPAAQITYKHLMRHLAARDDADLNDLGIAAARQAPLETFMQRRDAARRARPTDPDQE